MTAPVEPDAILRAHQAIRDVARHTPVLPSSTLTDRCGGAVVLKAENLQRTGSFKVRGALNKLAALFSGPGGCTSGVVCGSAGNHAQALAFAARERGVPCEVFMPVLAPIAKAEGAAELGAVVRLEGASVDECVALARARADASGLTFVHPFDDADVVAGQGTLGLELVADIPDLATVVIPLGGGGLAAGVAIAVKAARPHVRVVAVQVAGCASFPASLAAGVPVAVDAALTIADGIAVKRPGDLTLPLVREFVDEIVIVGEDEVAEAIVLLAEKAKLVVEGAGAVGAAALLGGQMTPADDGVTCVILSGGNLDPGLLAEVARRHETEAGRRLVLFTRVPDRPGALAALLDLVARSGANLVDVEHLREGVGLHVRETAVQLVLQTRGRDHADDVRRAVADGGYAARVVS